MRAENNQNPRACSGSIKTIGIIGTAFRKDDAQKLNPEIYLWMKETALALITKLTKEQGQNGIRLVSGGACGADHLAVSLFLENAVQSLSLHFPAAYNRTRVEFDHTFAGTTANFYHKRFSSVCFGRQTDSLLEIGLAIDKGSMVTESADFKTRNVKVAKEADYLIAFTFGNRATLKTGGSSHTMSVFYILPGKEPRNSWHVNLNDKIIYTPAKFNYE